MRFHKIWILTSQSSCEMSCWWHIYVSINWVIIGSDNGLLPKRTKPLPESLLTNCLFDTQKIIWIWNTDNFFQENVFENAGCVVTCTAVVSLCQKLLRPLAIQASGQFRSTGPNQILLDQILHWQDTHMAKFNKCCQKAYDHKIATSQSGQWYLPGHWPDRKFTCHWHQASANFSNWLFEVHEIYKGMFSGSLIKHNI